MFQLSNELIANIFKFDPTYKNIYSNIVKNAFNKPIIYTNLKESLKDNIYQADNIEVSNDIVKEFTIYIKIEDIYFDTSGYFVFELDAQFFNMEGMIDETLDNKPKYKFVGDYFEFKMLNTESLDTIEDEFDFLSAIEYYYTKNNIPMDKFSMKII